MLPDYYQYEVSVTGGILNTVICVYQKSSYTEYENKSRINEMLENLQLKLIKELPIYDEVWNAFVFQNSELDVKEFQKLDTNSQLYYKEAGMKKKDNDYNAANMLIMGMALLERRAGQYKNKQQKVENRLYMVTDDAPKREQISRIFLEDKQRILLHPRFRQLPVHLYLYKTEDIDFDLYETYVRSTGESHVQILKCSRAERNQKIWR